MKRRTKQAIQEQKEAIISEAINRFFGGITKQEAHEVFKLFPF
jgi:hypothetical protein